MFVDEVRIEVRGGAGGNGVVRFRREKFVPRGGPNGGDGGAGGSVYIVADPQLSTLVEFRHRRKFRAPAGGAGGSDNCHGKDGGDVVISVPVGTLVYEADRLVGDLHAAGERALVARGGRGGLGNQHFATSVRQTPRFAQIGEPGEERELHLQLKLLADAGIVGAPNAGKSTLLASVSAARPKIADYPFTTLEPQLGVVQVDVDAHFVLVDLPGLIEGASAGAGLGDQFLRHVERTRVLIHLIDGALAPVQALEQMAMIENELRAWNPALLSKQRILAVSKLDLPDSRATLDAVGVRAGQPVFGISAATGKGVRKLMQATYRAITQARAREAHEAAVAAPVFRPAEHAGRTPVSVVKEGDAFRVVGERLERLAAMTDFTSDDARAFFERALVRSGARRKLERLGIRAGDRLLVGPAEIIFS